MPRTVGHVDIDSHGLSAKCSICRKTISYPIGTGMTDSSFKAHLAEFVSRHNSTCGGGRTGGRKSSTKDGQPPPSVIE